MTTPRPTEITLHKQSRRLDIAFDDGKRFELPCEYLRVFSPSAEVRGHGPGQEVLQTGQRNVEISAIEPVGVYAVKLVFSDGHDTGLYSWDYLYDLGAKQASHWKSYLARLEQAGASRDVATPPPPKGKGLRRVSKTHFGYQEVDEAEKARKVGDVFKSVAGNYDLMNDLMSMGLHRLWKRFTIAMSGVREGARVLDVASGSGDLALAFAKRAGPTGQVWMTDINGAMLSVGRDKLIDAGIFPPLALCDAEALPFPANSFDCASVAFGLRNMTHKDRALAEMTRVVKPGGRVMVLEFSRPAKPLQGAYDAYSFSILPKIGKYVAKDEAAYRYLAESIRMHPDQDTLKAMMETAGLARVEYFNLTGGVVALHRGFKT